MSKATRLKIEKLSMLVKVECMIMKSNVRERQKYKSKMIIVKSKMITVESAMIIVESTMIIV